MRWTLVLLILVTSAYQLRAGETVQCQATRDVWLSTYKEEKEYNMGASPKIKLKGYDEFAILDFDVSKLKGKTISEAFLYIKPTKGAKLGLNAGSDISWVSMSTVGHEWVEGKSTKYAKDTKGFGATFNESSHTKDNWGWPGARAYDVILGHGNTLRHDTKAGADNGWLKAKLDLRLVQALVAGATHGMLLLEGTTNVKVNQYVASRESGKGPYLKVTIRGDDAEAPKTPQGLKVVPAPLEASPAHGAVMVTLTVPEGTLAYRVRIGGKDVDRWQIPFAAKAGSTQSFPIVDLAPGSDVKLEVAAVDGAGNASPFASAQAKVSEKLTVPQLPAFPFKPKAGDPKKLGGAVIWAFPEVTKVDPVSAKVLHEPNADGFQRKNPVWDGASATVRLAAAKGEIVSFQIAVQGKVEGCSVKCSSLKGPGEIPDKSARVWRNWYVKGNSEYALKLKGAFDCPSKDNGIAGQTLQAITVDYHIPAQAKAGDYTGTVTLSAGAEKSELAIKVKVYDVTIPDNVNFNPELNCYRGPGDAGSPQFKDSFRVAHYNRCTINRVPYSQSGSIDSDWTPKVDKSGRVTDWSGFDKNLGGLLDGSWFKDNPRAGVPVPTLYLPLFEGWPLNYRNHYNPGKGVPTSTKEKLKHDILAKPVHEAVGQAYKDAFVKCTQAFVAHFKEKGWTRTIAEMYQNNKPKRGHTMWTLDEPRQYLDWAAINHWAGLFKKGIDDPAIFTSDWHRQFFEKGLIDMKRDRPTFMYRGDISRPTWQGSLSNGLMSMVYANSGQFSFPRIMKGHKRNIPAILYCYGSCNAVGRNNWESAAWCLKAYAHECDGLLPWSSVGGESSLTKPNVNGLIINAGAHGHAVASFRVHALRRGAQDCELLRLLQIKKGWSRGHIGVLVSQRVPLTSTFKQAKADDAAPVTFEGLSSQGFCELKEGVLQLLTK